MRKNVTGFFVCCVLAVGCGQNGQPPAPAVAPTGPGSSPSPAKASADGDPIASPAETTERSGNDAADAQVTLKILDWDATETLIAEHKGKVVVVDMWSTSCAPCRKEFPHLVRLHKKYKNRVACVSVNCDYLGIQGEPPESDRDRVLEFLREKGATFDNVLSSVASDELFEKLEFASIPVVYVYGKDGTLKKRFDNEEGLYGDEGFTYQKDVIPFVEGLLQGE